MIIIPGLFITPKGRIPRLLASWMNVKMLEERREKSVKIRLIKEPRSLSVGRSFYNDYITGK